MNKTRQHLRASRSARRTQNRNIIALAAAACLSLATASTVAAKQNSTPGLGVQAAEFFFTGKPYDVDSGNYTFRYRNYNPELGRWTSLDPSGFPDGANNLLYINNHTLTAFDPDGLESKSINETFGFDIHGSPIVGAWTGAFVWSFAKNGEHASITPGDANSGFSGFTEIPINIEIYGTTVGIGFRTEAVYYNRSAIETEMRGDVQWKRYVVDLEVKFKKILTIGVDVYSDWMSSESHYENGAWYE